MCFFSRPNVDNSASIYYEQQQQAEKERQKAIADAMAAVNQNFAGDARQPIYDQIYDAALSNYTNDIQEQFENAQDRLRISLARQGLGGSSRDAVRGQELRERMSEAMLEAQRQAEQLRRAAMADDQRVRGSLIQQAQTGLDATSAAEIVSAALASNTQNALSNARRANFGNMFADFGQAVQGGVAGGARRRGFRDQDEEYSTYFNTGGYSPTVT